MGKERRKVPKQSYHRPRLKIYGDIRELTQNAGISSKKQDGFKNFKTA
jgi:hypothetical protein